jgi:hypothetical protein
LPTNGKGNILPDNRQIRPSSSTTSRQPANYRRSTPPPPIVAYEDVIAACGHPEKFGLFEDRLDKYRKDRRKKVTDRACKACRERKRLEEEEALRVRREEKQQRAAAAAQAAPPPKLHIKPPSGRLPDGSKFELAYDASETRWNGTLTTEEKVFTGSAGNLFKLLNRLDQQYRQSLGRDAGQEPGAENISGG